MKRVAVISAVLWTALTALPSSAVGEDASTPEPLKCDTGPVARTYGKTQWLVYSCDDQRSVVIVSAPGSPAAPFYFIFFPSEGGYRLRGEGTGRKDATSAAFTDLRALSGQDIAVLIEQTKTH